MHGIFFPITIVHFRSKLLRGKNKIARRHLEDNVKKTASKNVPHVQYEFFFFSFNPSNHVFKSLFLSTVMFRLLKAALAANCVRIPLGFNWHEWFGDIRKRNKNVAKCRTS